MSANDEFPAGIGNILGALPVAVLVVDAHGIIVMFNQEAESLLGCTQAEAIGRSVDEFVPDSKREQHAGLTRAFFGNPTTRRMGAGRDLLARRADGRLVPVEIALKPIAGAYGSMVIATIIDISLRKALEAQAREATAELERRVAERTAELEESNREKQAMLECLEKARADLERLSREDALTGLANRREFDQRLAIEEQRCQRHHHPLCVAMLDIDRFKQVNDRPGHALGDEVLRRIARVLERECRVEDIVARYGGEEFALALPVAGLEDARILCERMRSAVELQPWGDLRPGLRVTISIGVAMRQSGESASAALARADALLYEAKRRGRNRVEGAVPP
jgi:diguanylate cyclase (GGDEF)-like protein/PAS domain S-box-containing protein